MKKRNLVFAGLAIMMIGLAACEKLLPAKPESDQLLDGPVDGLTSEEKIRFLAGDVAFNEEIFTAEKGLGPYFVATSCGSCHAGDGKGHPFTTLTRFGQYDSTGNMYMAFGGPQLQNKAIPGYIPEHVPAGAPFSKFTPPANTGLGFLEALSDAQLLVHADPLDVDADGISGVPNYITPPGYFQALPHHLPVGGKYIGRFGKKAAAINLLHQTANAYNQDMGITSEFNPSEPAINGITGPYGDGTPDPEVPASTVFNVVFYLETLKAPIQRDQNDPEVQQGKMIFTAIGCAKCHVPEFTTPSVSIAALSNKKIFPYTDLLLHDMGAGLNDNYTEGMATAAEWKTPALWGLGLSKSSQGGNYFLLHDGRASSIEEAILLHGGEGSASKNAFQSLSTAEKNQLVKFLESL